MKRNIIILITVNFLIILIFELSSLAILNFWNPSFTLELAVYEKKDKKLQKILNSIQNETEYFCDQMHTYENLQKIMAETILSKKSIIKPNFRGKQWWFFGGSTTKTHTCGLRKSYPEYIQDQVTDVEVINFAGNGHTSDEMMLRLERALRKSGKKIDTIFWGSWINEILFLYRDLKFANADVYRKFPEFKNKKSVEAKYQWSGLSKTLYKYSKTYKLMFHLIHRDNVLLLQDNNKDLRVTGRFIDAVLYNYKLNLERIYQLKLKYNFKFVFIQPPYRKHLIYEYKLPIDGKMYRLRPESVQRFLDELDIIRNKIEWKNDFINLKIDLNQYTQH